MKLFPLIAAAALTLAAAPAKASPQWVPVSADGTVFANYNCVRQAGNVRSISVGFILSQNERIANVTHIDCRSWHSSFTYLNKTKPWEPIAPGSVMEDVAMLVCPKQG